MDSGATLRLVEKHISRHLAVTDQIHSQPVLSFNPRGTPGGGGDSRSTLRLSDCANHRNHKASLTLNLTLVKAFVPIEGSLTI
jgi:hypothetical protein